MVGQLIRLGMFTAYAIDNDLNYVVDKIRNYYELGDYKSDDEMNAADQAVASDLEKPDSKGRRTRGKKAESATPTDAPEEKTGRTRKSRSEVQAENEQKIADHMDEVDKAIDQAFPGQEEVPFDEAMDVADKVPKPDLQKPPRRTRKERNAEKSEPVQDGTTNTDSESVTLKADAYFYVPADDNYVMKHKGDTVDLITIKYINGYVGMYYDLHLSGIPLVVPINQDQVVKAVRTDSKLSSGLYTKLGEDVGYLKRSIRAELSRGIASGSTWNEMALRIAKGMNSPFRKAYNNAIRIARTEGHRIQNEAWWQVGGNATTEPSVILIR